MAVLVVRADRVVSVVRGETVGLVPEIDTLASKIFPTDAPRYNLDSISFSPLMPLDTIWIVYCKIKPLTAHLKTCLKLCLDKTFSLEYNEDGNIISLQTFDGLGIVYNKLTVIFCGGLND